MPSLRQLLAAHAPVLLLDAASSRVQAGWLPGPDLAQSRWATSDEETGVGLFRSVEALGVDLGAAGAFVFCDGPGSVLGIRTTAMALRTWGILRARPMFAYSSLALVAHALGRPEIGVIADARRELWHHYNLGGKLRRLPTAELTGELVMPARFRHWSQPPAGLTEVPYALADLLPCVADADLFRPTDAPDAFLHEEPSYVTWTPQIHRAPAAP
ncbi:MAG: peptidase M22 [Verrucomicrobia bacterium]|nr:peptidase M22 [Verrucomicrobiota bacterium]